MSPILIGIVVASYAAMLALVIGLFKSYTSDTKAEFAKINDWMQAKELVISRIGMVTDPLWKRVQDQIANELHHPDPRYHEMDELLEQLNKLVISDAGRRRLKELLELRQNDVQVSQGQRTSATLMLLVMEKVLLDKAVIHEASKLEP